MKCIFCGTALVDQNISLEHIIPNSIGGRLKSRNILCKKCNSDFGNTIDSVLSKSLSQYMTLLNLKRERGSSRKVKLISKETGEEYYLSEKGLEMSRPIIESSLDHNNKGSIRISPRSMKEGRMILNSIAKKFNLDEDTVNEALNNTQREYVRIPEKLKIGLHLGGEQFNRAVAKIAVCFYCHVTESSNGLSEIISYVKNGSDNEKKYVTFFYDKNEQVNQNDYPIYHYIGIHSTDNKIYAYIELFSAFKLVVILSENHDRECLNEYYYEELCGENIEHQSKALREFELNEIMGKTIHDYSNEFKNNHAALLNVVQKSSVNREIERITSKTCTEIFEKYKDEEYITHEMVSEILNLVAQEYIKMREHIDSPS